MPRRDRTKPKTGWRALGFADTGFLALVRRRAGVEKARRALLIRGIADDTLARIEVSAAQIKNDHDRGEPITDEILAALSRIKGPAVKLSEALEACDELTKRYLRRHCDVLAPDDPARIGVLHEDIQSLLGAIDTVALKEAKWHEKVPLPMRLAGMVRDALDQNGKFEDGVQSDAVAILGYLLDAFGMSRAEPRNYFRDLRNRAPR